MKSMFSVTTTVTKKKSLRALLALWPILSLHLCFGSPRLHSTEGSVAERSDVKHAVETAVIPITYADVENPKYQDQLVSVTGTLSSQFHDLNSSIVIIDMEGHLLIAGIGGDQALPELPTGSTIRLVGYDRIDPKGYSASGRIPRLALRSLADVQVIAGPPWATFRNFLEVLIFVLFFVTAFIVRAAFLRWQAINKKVWTNRSILIAKERSRILELISCNKPFSDLMVELDKSTQLLLPGLHCHFEESSQIDERFTAADSKDVSPNEKSLFSLNLKNDRGITTGRVTITGRKTGSLPPDYPDIFTLISELAALATRQASLYHGLIYHSTHDPLTELPNRRLCESRLAEALSESHDKEGQLAVIYIDINRFKYINDKYGHKVGDIYLQQIAMRLKSQIRAIDTLARIGGDEFMVIAPFPEAYDRAHALTARLKRCFDDPFELEGELINGSASFGFARYPEHGTTAEELKRHADHAMYLTKHQRRTPGQPQTIAIITPDELEMALVRGRFRLAYQPQFSASGLLTGLEALLRLEDPVLGVVTPDAFISVAENHPVIVGIGNWVLRCALEDAMAFGVDQGRPVSITVNVSARQIEEAGYAEGVLKILNAIGFPPERLELELIERSLILSGPSVRKELEKLRAAGVKVSLDDFGTEQSCLSALHKLPIDTIKLDRSFISAMDTEAEVIPIIQAIVSMARSLGKRVVAEAIEHTGPVPQLLAMGTMDFQGYLLGRPVPASTVAAQIKTWRAGITMPAAFTKQESNRRPSPLPSDR